MYQTYSGDTTLTCSASVPILQNEVVGLANAVYSKAFSANGLSASLLANDTAYISGVEVLDAQGNAEPEVRIFSASGVNYNAQVASTPEPSSIVLLGIGLLGMVGVAKGRFAA